MLGEMVAVKPRLVIGLDKPKPLLEVPRQRYSAVVQMVENPKAHMPSGQAVASIASAIFSAVIKVGKLVLAQGTVGNSDASTTRNPLTPRTRP